MKLFVFAGETSGDLHGEKVVSALKALDKNLHCEGVAGPKMRNLGIKGPYKMEDFQVMGFTDVLINLPDLYNKFYCL
ncbi:MAG: lipid-A-disaccharide synthase, partial [Parachlamydiaceae bacterium]